MFGAKKPAPPAKPAAPAPTPTATTKPSSNGPTAPASANAAASNAAPALSPEEAQRRVAATMRVSVVFAQVVSVLMRSPVHKHFSLADLEWLVMPPLLTGQCRVAEAKTQPDGPGTPVAVALWASVSPEVDKRLSENLNAPVRLRPDEWKSGDILWLVEAVGDGRIVLPLLKQLDESVFKGQTAKMRARGADGKPTVSQLRTELAAAEKSKTLPS